MPFKPCVLVLAVAVAFGAQRMMTAQSIAAVPQITVHELGEGERPLIDGHVDDMSWSTTESFSAFVQQESASNTTARSWRKGRQGRAIAADSTWIGMPIGSSAPG